ncbi:MAG: haloacid dehalogenase type II [Gemmatimonadota bacterium]
MLDLTRFSALTFDCYGTLIDWESGIAAALRKVVSAHGLEISDERLLDEFAVVESPIQSGPFLRYRDVLAASVHALGGRLGFVATAKEAASLPESLASWCPFPDTVAALRGLGSRYRLGVISNTDDDLFAASAGHLGAAFSWVITAEQVGSYKPSHRNFAVALERIGLPKDRILHVAQSVFHDVAPAQSLGLATVWVNRRAGRAGSGATPEASAVPDLTVPDLATLAALVEEQFRR